MDSLSLFFFWWTVRLSAAALEQEEMWGSSWKRERKPLRTDREENSWYEGKWTGCCVCVCLCMWACRSKKRVWQRESCWWYAERERCVCVSVHSAEWCLSTVAFITAMTLLPPPLCALYLLPPSALWYEYTLDSPWHLTVWRQAPHPLPPRCCLCVASFTTDSTLSVHVCCLCVYDWHMLHFSSSLS